MKRNPWRVPPQVVLSATRGGACTAPLPLDLVVAPIGHRRAALHGDWLPVDVHALDRWHQRWGGPSSQRHLGN